MIGRDRSYFVKKLKKTTLILPEFSETDIIKMLEFYITATDRSTSYPDLLYLELDSKERLRTKLYDKGDHFNFPIVIFPFICTNISVAPAYGVYISQLIQYSRACGSYHDLLNRRLLLTRKLLNQWFLLVKLTNISSRKDHLYYFCNYRI